MRDAGVIKWLGSRPLDFYLILHSCALSVMTFGLIHELILHRPLGAIVMFLGACSSILNIRHYRRRLRDFSLWLYEKGGQDCPRCRKSTGVAPAPHSLN